MRTSLLLGGSILLLACGDDSGGTGGAGAGTTASSTTSAPSSSPSSSASTGDGGGGTTTATTAGTGGAGGQGGAGDGGSGGSGGVLGPSETVAQACERLNATYDALAEELGCPVTPGNCNAAKDPCDPELIAFMDCLRTGTQAEDCSCAFDPEQEIDLLTCGIGDCQGENDAYVECAF